jgi:pyrrolysine biosynthesis protein PylC
MRLLVVGGRLQGVEAVYLAKKAGFWVRVVDRADPVPAMDMGDEFRQLDVTAPHGFARAAMGIDLILPALENMKALRALSEGATRLEVPIAFDLAAYDVSRSKLASDRLFAAHQIPAPTPWPRCGYPVVIKPSEGSGSQGVRLLAHEAAREKHYGEAFPPERAVVQQHLSGPAYSVEVMGKPGRYRVLPATELEMDAEHDCKRVLAPSGLSATSEADLAAIGRACAEALRLNGIMDVEVILHQGQFKVLEVDARLPSQTPMAVFHSSGQNEVAQLADLFLSGICPQASGGTELQAVILEHVRVADHRLEVCGEHIMAVNQPLRWVRGFYGADEALTTCTPGAGSWVATLVITGPDRKSAWAKRGRVLAGLEEAFDLTSIVDPMPQLPWKNGAAP